MIISFRDAKSTLKSIIEIIESAKNNILASLLDIFCKYKFITHVTVSKLSPKTIEIAGRSLL